MKVGVIGAGWAGLAAASSLRHAGHEVELFESSHSAGGRARGVKQTKLGTIDNGQHLLLGAYTSTLTLFARDNPRYQAQLHREPLCLASVDGQFEIRATKTGGSPLSAALALFKAKGLNLSDKCKALRLLMKLAIGSSKQSDNRSVSAWLDREQQSPRLCQWLWHPLCLATLNTPPEVASASLFSRVLRDSLLSREAGATDMLIASVDLSALWPDHVAESVTTHWGHTVRCIEPLDTSVNIDDTLFDACVIAAPPYGVARMLSQAAQNNEPKWINQLAQFDYRAITTCYVDLDGPLRLRAPMLLMQHNNDPIQPGQWVFDRNAYQPKLQSNVGRLAFVISDSASLSSLPDDALAQRLMSQLHKEWQGSSQQAHQAHRPPHPWPAIASFQTIHEKRATFAATCGLDRPANQTPWPRILVAGDWTNTGYPSVIEGAVRSGIESAHHIIGLEKSWGL
jgi:squalene-associated FAD-dependent desaturase